MPVRFSRTAIVGAGWSLFAFIIPFVLVFASYRDAPRWFSILFWLLAPLGVPAIFGTTILGWIAVSQIRRSAGKLYGMGLAVFDGLLFPLLAVDAVIGEVWIFLLKVVLNDHRLIPIVGLLALATMVGIDYLIIHLVWRAVNKAAVLPVQKPDRFWRWFAVTVLALIAIPIVISILGMLAAIAIPNFVKARERARENAQHAAAPRMTNSPAAPNFSFGPVVERTLTFDQSQVSPLFCLNDGTLIFPPPEAKMQSATVFEDWWRGTKADLLITVLGKEITIACLKDDGAKFAEVSARDWESASPTGLAEALRNASSHQPVVSGLDMFFLPESVALPETFVVESRTGEKGLLQITGFTDNPRGVRIRYKLVQSQSATAAYPGDWIWEPNSQTLERVPPIFLFRPSTLPASAVPFDMFGKDRFLARGKTLKELIEVIWSQKNSALKIIFDADLPEDKFDFIVTDQFQWWDKLESEINQRFNLVEQIETGEGGDVVVVKNASVAVPPGNAKTDVQQRAETLTRADPKLAEQPPVVVETYPVSGATNVPRGETEIRVRFSKPMTDGSWSWSTAWENSTPESVGPPHYLDDHCTCVMKVRLEPDKTYAWWLNSGKFKNFTDQAGQPAVPYLLIFQTKPN